MKNKRQIILASTSPRRKELLAKLGLSFKATDSGYEEDMTKKMAPKKLAQFLAFGKAQAVAKKYPKAIIIAADTFVVLGKKILGKPKSITEARQMLKSISGKKVGIITGLAMIDVLKNKTITAVGVGDVYIKKMNDLEISNYLLAGESMDRAGAFAVQGKGAAIIRKINGDFYSIVGLPVYAVADNLKKLGVHVL